MLDFQTEAILKLSEFRKEAYDYVRHIDIPNIKNERHRRLFGKIKDIGTGALKNVDDLKKVRSIAFGFEDSYCIENKRVLE